LRGRRMSIAGDFFAGPPPNAKWTECDGDTILNTRHVDYWRRVHFRYGGRGIGGMRLPNRPGWSICIDDDPDFPPVQSAAVWDGGATVWDGGATVWDRAA